MGGDGSPTTDYLVLAFWDNAASGPVPGQPPDTWAPGLWREVGVLSVAQRTTRPVVVEKAKELVACMFELGNGQAVRVRVAPLDDVTEAEVSMQVPAPVLTATVIPRERPVQPELTADAAAS